MKKNRSDLEWFLDFMWIDLEKGEEGELGKLAVELGLKTIGVPIAGPDPREFGEKVSEATMEADLFNYGKDGGGRVRLQRLQKVLRDHFLEMMNRIKKVVQSGLPVKEVDLGITLISGTESEYALAQSQQKITTTAYIHMKSKYKEGTKKKLQIWPEEEFKNTTIQVWEMATSDEETVIYNFIRSLHGATLGQFRQCPECRRYYLHTTNREKIFCSNRCAARKNSRDRRARIKNEEPDKYRDIMDENTKRARASYVNKIRQKYPNAKVPRRPRTKKGG